MTDLLCPFSAPLVKNDFGCRHAREIIRRGGSEIACEHAQTHTHCCAVHAFIKQSALGALGHEDDLLTVPHNVLIKIQYGGLLGLQALLEGDSAPETVEEVATLIESATERYPELNDLPLDDINNHIANYKTQRRSRKK